MDDQLAAVSSQDQITITGYEHKAIAARDAIKAIVDELEEMISEDITLDSRVHARIIGARGKGIRKIMDEFKVRKNWRKKNPITELPLTACYLGHHVSTQQHKRILILLEV